jgi:hypothetical protein
MTTTTSAITDPVEWSARSLLRTVFAHLRPREFAVELWDGEQWPPEPNGPQDFKLIFRTPNVVRGIFSDVSSLSFGEAYIHGHLDIHGPLIDVLRLRRKSYRLNQVRQPNTPPAYSGARA